jgi:hypothetical protein
VGSFVAFCRRRGWPVQDLIAGLDRRREKGRHKNLRSLQRYVRPSSEAVAALTAPHDPACRRRS